MNETIWCFFRCLQKRDYLLNYYEICYLRELTEQGKVISLARFFIFH